MEVFMTAKQNICKNNFMNVQRTNYAFSTKFTVSCIDCL